ncbi:hypothetical protein D3OALGA1CA_3453 [Olavius algarvensis associated proteobacterium Delta 3]|nr:hypothetical protein D3OALGB2SA_3849 [Olavius algarvensis associated proteobacterium Delta 3]CAB5134639.1 hypothetical protein D3OALGA1CA_3453 [Olavius algarvensis associated proteobacterium Delta 3]
MFLIWPDYNPRIELVKKKIVHCTKIFFIFFIHKNHSFDI